MSSILDKLASSSGSRKGEPNREAAIECAKKPELLDEIAKGFESKNGVLRGDSAEVFAEAARIDPKVVAPHIEVMLGRLSDKNNRVRWEILQAISAVAPLTPEKIYPKRELLLEMAEEGSVIVKDGAIATLSKVAGSSHEYRQVLLQPLLKFLKTCIPRDVPRYGEYLLEAVKDDPNARASLESVLLERLPECNQSGAARVKRLLKRLE